MAPPKYRSSTSAPSSSSSANQRTSFNKATDPTTLAEQKAAEERVKQLMSRSIVAKSPEKLYTSYSNGGIRSKEDKQNSARKKQAEGRDTLSQWYGMKRYSKNLTSDMRQDLELLRYRNFLDKSTSHLASARGTSKKISPFFEVGYFTDTTKKQKRRSRRFADEMLNEDKELRERVDQVAKRETKRRQKENEKASKRRNLNERKANERKKKGKKANPRDE